MADVDTSIYRQSTPPGGLGSMSVLDLLSLARQAGELNTARAQSDALTANPNDPAAAARAFNADPRATFKTPGMMQGFTSQEQANFQLRQSQMAEAVKGISSLITKPRASVNDFNQIAPLLAGYGVPPQMIADVAAGPQSGPDFVRRLAVLHNWVSQNSGLPTVATQLPGGITVNVPVGSTLYQGAGAGSPQKAAGTLSPSAAPASPAGGRAPGEVVTSRPGAAEATATSARASGGLFTQHQQMGADFTSNTYALDNAIQDLQAMGPKSTGPLTDEANKIKSFMVSFGLDKRIGLDMSKEVTDFESAKKWMTQYIGSQSAGGTDARLAAAFSSNANTSLQQSTNLGILKSFKTLVTMQSVMAAEFEKTGKPSAEYASWARQWQRDHDVRAFGFNMMTAADRKAMFEKMTPADRARFDASIKAAEDNGFLRPTGQQGSAAPPSAQQPTQFANATQ